MTERLIITPIATDFLEKHADQMFAMAANPPSPARRRSRRGKGFRKVEIPPSTPRGLFTVFLTGDKENLIGQVWAASPASAATLMAPWAKNRLRRARKATEVPVELVGWDDSPTRADLSKMADIPEDELDPGLTVGSELCHVWVAEHEEDGKERSLYIIETIPLGVGLNGDD